LLATPFSISVVVSMRIPQTRSLLPAATLLACLVAATLSGCQKPKSAPSIDDLSAALQHSADQALAAPTLVDAQIVVPPKPGRLDAQTKEIEQLFSEAGGTGLASVNAKGQTSILGSIPADNLDSFKARLRNEKAGMNLAPKPPTVLVEVLIDTPHPSPSPTP
jgi:hypothetical protein